MAEHANPETPWVSDEDLPRRLGVPEKFVREALEMFDRMPNTGFPQKQKLWGNRRYYPAIEAYFAATYGLNSQVGAARLATENRDRTRLPRPQPAELKRRA